MPYTAAYADEGRGLIRIGAGVVTTAELMAVARQQIAEAEKCRQVRYGLVDFSAVTEFRVVPEDVWNLAELNRHLTNYIPRDTPVVIIASDVLVYAMARIWRTLTDDMGWISYLARTKADGVAWLKEELIARGGGPAALDQYPNLTRYLESEAADSQTARPD